MTRIIVLDTGPLGLLVRSRQVPIADECARWLRGLLDYGERVVLPAIAEYEVRRELVRLNAHSALRRLDVLASSMEYVDLTAVMLRQAAQLWGDLRREGRPTADPHALDGDVILAAQALSLASSMAPALVATTNVGHLRRMIAAEEWQTIQPERD